MTIGGRIKEIRRSKRRTQQEFADSLGLKRQTIAASEIGNISTRDRTISDICREFGVDEVWLRTGVGEMFRQRTREEEIMTFARDTIAGSEEFRKSLVTMLAKLDADDWEHLAAIFGKMTGEKEE